MALAVHEALKAPGALQVCRLDKEQTPVLDFQFLSACPMFVQAPSGRSLHGTVLSLDALQFSSVCVRLGRSGLPMQNIPLSTMCTFSDEGWMPLNLYSILHLPWFSRS